MMDAITKLTEAVTEMPQREMANLSPPGLERKKVDVRFMNVQEFDGTTRSGTLVILAQEQHPCPIQACARSFVPGRVGDVGHPRDCLELCGDALWFSLQSPMPVLPWVSAVYPPSGRRVKRTHFVTEVAPSLQPQDRCQNHTSAKSSYPFPVCYRQIFGRK